MNLDDIFKDNINNNYCENDDSSTDCIENQTLQVLSACDCLLTFSKIKLNRSLSYFIRQLKRDISRNNLKHSYSIETVLKQLRKYKKSLNNEEYNAIIEEIEQYFEMCLIMDVF